MFCEWLHRERNNKTRQIINQRQAGDVFLRQVERFLNVKREVSRCHVDDQPRQAINKTDVEEKRLFHPFNPVVNLIVKQFELKNRI